MPKSKDVIEMTQIVNNIDKESADYTERRNLATLLLRMYTDLDKTIRRSDEHGNRSKWTIRVGAAATAAASAVAGTTLVAGSTGTVAIVVGAVTASLGVIGSVVAALKLSDSVTQNESNHAQYLPLFRKLGSYAATDLFTASIRDIKTQLDTFADEISAVEAADAASPGGAAVAAPPRATPAQAQQLPGAPGPAQVIPAQVIPPPPSPAPASPAIAGLGGDQPGD